MDVVKFNIEVSIEVAGDVTLDRQAELIRQIEAASANKLLQSKIAEALWIHFCNAGFDSSGFSNINVSIPASDPVSLGPLFGKSILRDMPLEPDSLRTPLENPHKPFSLEEST